MKIDFIPNMIMAPEGGDAGAGAGGAGSGTSDGAAVNQGGDTAGSADPGQGKMNVTVNDGTQGGNSGSAKVPFGSGDGGDGEQKMDVAALLGDYAKDPAFEAFKDGESFDVQKIAKAYKDTKALVGQKLGIPGEDASDEAKAEFYKALGVPEDVDGYGFEMPEDLPDALKESYDDEHAKKWAGIFKEHNIPADAAKAIRAEFYKEVSEEIGNISADAGHSAEEFDKVATEMFGDKKEQVLKDANVLLQKYVPEDIRADIEKSVPDTVLLAMAAAITGETKHLTGEDKAIGGDAGASGESAQQLQEKARNLMRDPAYNSPFAKGPEEHERLKKEVRGIYQRIYQINKATKG